MLDNNVIYIFVILVLLIILIGLIRIKRAHGFPLQQHHKPPYVLIENDGRKYAYIVNDIVLSGKKALRDLEVLINVIEDRYKDSRGTSYIIVSCISKKGVRTYLILAQEYKGPEPVELLSEYYILKSIVDSRLKNIRIRALSLTKDNAITVPLPNILGFFNFTGRHELSNMRELLSRSHIQLSSNTRSWNLMKPDSIYNNDKNSLEIHIGTLLNDPRINICIPLVDLERHTLIIGSTGFGKTTTATKIIKEIVKKKLGNIIVLDWHNEYANKLSQLGLVYHLFKPGKSQFRQLAIPLIIFNEQEDLYSSVEIIEKVMGLTPPQTYVLVKVLDKLKKTGNEEFELKDILKHIKINEYESHALFEAKMALYRKLYQLVYGSSRYMFKGAAKNQDLTRLIKNITSRPIAVIELGHIRNTHIRTLYSIALLKCLFEILKTANSNHRLFVVVEEIENMLYNNSIVGLFLQLLMESRKYGLYFILISHSIANLPIHIVENTSTKIIHSIKTDKDLSYVKNAMNLSRELLELIPYLKPGEVIVVSMSLNEPILCNITL